LAPGVADPEGHWHSCKLDINNCSPDQLDLMQGECFLERFFQQVFILFSPQNIELRKATYLDHKIIPCHI